MYRPDVEIEINYTEAMFKVAQHFSSTNSFNSDLYHRLGQYKILSLLEKSELRRDKIVAFCFLHSFFGSGKKFAVDVSPVCGVYLEHEHYIDAAQFFRNSKFLCILRNPLENLWSHLRLPVGDRKSIDLREYWKNHLKKESLYKILPYDSVIMNISRGLKNDRFSIIFFEDLIQMKENYPVFKDLGIKFDDSFDFNEVVNYNSTNAEFIDEGLRAELFMATRRNYEFAFEYFKGQLPQSWLEDMNRYK